MIEMGTNRDPEKKMIVMGQHSETDASYPWVISTIIFKKTEMRS